MKCTRLSSGPCSVLILSLAALAGCQGGKVSKVTLTCYPPYWNETFKRAAVIPFDCPTDRAKGQALSNKLEAALIGNGTYEIYTRTRLKEVLDEKDLAAAGIIDMDTAQRIGKLASVQLLICGAYSRGEKTSRQETRYRQVARYGTDANGNRVVTGYDQVPYIHTINNAVVDCSATAIDTVTGRQYAAFGKSIAKTSETPATIFHSRLISAEALFQQAEQEALDGILRAIAVTKTECSLPKQPLRVATGLYDGKWEWTSRVTGESEKIVVVVKLPEQASRNPFIIAIVPEQGRDVVVEQSFTWQEGNAEQGFDFELAPIVQRAGYGQFLVKLYSGLKLHSGLSPIAWYNFHIVPDRTAGKPGNAVSSF